MTIMCTGMALVLAACEDSPTDPVIEPAASAAEINAYLPAIADLKQRIVPTAKDAEVSKRLVTELTKLESTLAARTAVPAYRAAERARQLISSCSDECLSAPERAVIVLTLDHAKRLIGTQAGAK